MAPHRKAAPGPAKVAMGDAHGRHPVVAVARSDSVRQHSGMTSKTLLFRMPVAFPGGDARVDHDTAMWKAKACERWENEGERIPRLARPAGLDNRGEASLVWAAS
jgi:hypothetical protein